MRRSDGTISGLAKLLCLLALVCSFGLRLSAEDESLDFQEELAFKQAVAVVAPAVVRIETVGGLDRIGDRLLGNGPTTGLVVGADGWIMTSSFNFIGKPTGIIVTLSDGRKLPAEVVATDYSCHLTLLKVDASGLAEPSLANIEKPRIGQWTLAVGRSYPNGQPSVSVGVLSAVDRIHGKALQTDAKISPVNYGGPLIDLRGSVLGILVPLSPDGSDDLAGIEWYDSGIGFAIPLQRIRRVLPRLQAGESLKQGLAGFSILNPNQDGTTVERVRIGSPAFQAGLRKNDVIFQVDDRAVRRNAEIRQAMGQKYAGESVAIRFKRGEETNQLDLRLADELPPYEMPSVGVLLKKRVSNEAGVSVRGIVPDSPAAKAGIQPDDVIVAWNGQPVSGIDELKSELCSRIPGDEVSISIKHGDQTRKINLALASAAVQTPGQGPLLRSASVPLKVAVNQVDSPEFERRHWIMEPTDLPANHIQTLLVWLHPPGKSSAQEIQLAWEQSSDSRGLVIAGPVIPESRNWDVDDIEYLKRLIESERRKYHLSRERVVLYGGPGTGVFPLFLAFKDLNSVGGVILSNPTTDAPLPDLEPENALRVCLLRDPDGQSTPSGIQKRIEQMKYPLTIIQNTTERNLPEGKDLDQLIDWVDSTDRL